MRQYFILIVVLFCVINIFTISAQLPDPEKTYLVQSSGDGMYLRGNGWGEFCVSLDRVSLRWIFADPPPDNFKWKVSYNNQSGSATIKAFIPEESYQLNIVSSIEERNECNNPMRAVELISDGDGAPFLIQSVGTNACLSSFGSEVGVASWVDCDFSNGIFRHWYFEATP